MYFIRRQEIIGTPSAAGPSKAASGNLLNAANPAVSMSYTYDDRNLQLTITNDTIAKTVGYTYDENGRKISLTYPDGETIAYTRDARGQVTHLASNQPGLGGEPAPSVAYAYNPDGSLATMDYGFGMHVARVYDPATGRLIDLRYTKPDGTVISDFAYTLDAAGNILSTTTDFGLVQYGYDALDRLTGVDYGTAGNIEYGYDRFGNLERRTVGLPPELCDEPSFDFSGSMRAQNRLPEGAGFEYDAAGNLESIQPSAGV